MESKSNNLQPKKTKFLTFVLCSDQVLFCSIYQPESDQFELRKDLKEDESSKKRRLQLEYSRALSFLRISPGIFQNLASLRKTEEV